MSSLASLVRVLGQAKLVGDGNVEICSVMCDSRLVVPGALFVCVTGFATDGHKYAAQAIERGAVALVVEHVPEHISEVPYVIVPNCRKALAVLSAELLGRPADKLVNVGITGTNGKTTTSYLIRAVMEAHGLNPGLLGTIEARIGNTTRKLNNTTPESLDLHTMFAEMVREGQDGVVMEVSSHALALDRTYGIPYDIAVFTNLTQDHLDFHGDMESYFQAKCKLFSRLGTHGDRPMGPFAVVNIDDAYGRRLVELVRDRVPVITYGTAADADVRAYNVTAGPHGLSYMLETRVGARQVTLKLAGLFNLHNSLAAIATGFALRAGLDTVVQAVESVEAIPGRFQLVPGQQDFTVLVDYAHTPDGLKNLLESARVITANRLTVVFGCGGDRDKTKRCVMGRIASDLADKVYVTTDNPRSENVEEIIAQIVEGVQDHLDKVEVIVDRARAINKAVSEARAGDTVVIAGKGHETYQLFEKRKVHFDDVEVAKAALAHVNCPADGVRPKLRLQTGFDAIYFKQSEYGCSTAVSGGN